MLPTDGVQTVKIVGTKSGKIFLCGGDGHLYEVEYFPEVPFANVVSYCFRKGGSLEKCEKVIGLKLYILLIYLSNPRKQIG